MAGSLNKVTLIGNLGKDPEVKALQSGSKVCNLSLATSERWRDKASGEAREKTEWHRIVIFNDRLAEVAEKYLRKGSKVYVEGQLETRKWTDKDGSEKHTTEIVLKAFNGQLVLLDKIEASPAQSGESSYAPRTPAKVSAAALIDDEIPF